MKLSLFDLHCDTPYEMFRKKQSLTSNNLAVSLQKAASFDCFVQVMAFWTESSLSDSEGWERFLQMHRYLLSDTAIERGEATVVSDYVHKTPCKNTLILAIEDARILENHLSRVDVIAKLGVRILTPFWASETCLGGAHNTSSGLTDFGKRALQKALEQGILLDVSHASVRSADEIFALCAEHQRPVLATHSNAYDICPVSRNLNNDQIHAVIKSDGLMGINLHKGFLSNRENPKIEDLLAHIEHFLTHGALNHLCIGADMDGCDLLNEIPNLSEFPLLAEKMLQKNYPEKLIRKLFFENADRFAKTYLTM